MEKLQCSAKSPFNISLGERGFNSKPRKAKPQMKEM
jgi:hypothetical protein